MKIDVITLKGAKDGALDLPDDIFGITSIRADLLQRCVTWQPSRLSTVTGVWVPASSKRRVMPSFLAITPVRMEPALPTA